MKTNLIRTSLALLLASFTTVAIAQTAPQVIDIPLSRPGEPVDIEISILSARIEVIGEDREDASFEVSVEEGTRKIVTPSGTKSLKTGAYSIEIEENDNRIDVDTDWRANKVNVVARVPRNANLELSTVNDGEIIVSNIIGKLVLQNVNGPITASNINGSVIAESVNENITVGFTGINTDAAMAFSSVNGDLNVGLPAGTGAERCLAAFYYAVSQNRERDFVWAAGQAIFSKRIDVSTDEGLEIVAERSGLFWPEVKEALADDSWRESVKKNREDLTELGLWGVPSFRIGNIAMWGQDRDWLLVRKIEDMCAGGQGIME